MVRKILIPLFISSLVLFTSCKEENVEPVKSKKVTSGPANEFTITGDSYSNELAEIDTSDVLNGSSYVSLHNTPDSLQIGIYGSCILNGVKKNVFVAINTQYKGTGTYSLGSPYTSLVTIGYIDGSPGQYYSSKEYNSASGTLILTKVDQGKFVEGEYFGSFMINNDPATLIQISGGKFITKFN